MATALQAIQNGRRRVIAHEVRMTQIMLNEYEAVSRAIEREMRRIQPWIDAAIEAGIIPDEAWLRRQTWYRQLEASVDVQMERFQRSAISTLTQAQAGSLAVATETAAVWRSTLQLPFAGRINAPAFERWVSAAQPGSPIQAVIDRYGDGASKIIRAGITEGMGTGQGSSAITRRIMRDLGPSGNEARISTIVRTESMRSYRGGFADTMETFEQQGIITGYRWIAAMSPRTCLACLSMDGRVFPTYQNTQHVACRCVMAPVVATAYAPAGGRPRQTGAEWLARQDEKTQRRVLPPGHYEAYKAGVPISDMVTTRSNPVWGPNVAIKPLRDIRPGELDRAA